MVILWPRYYDFPFRLDFVNFVLAQPEATDQTCNKDQFIVTAGSKVPSICGTNTGQHSKLFKPDKELSSFEIYCLWNLNPCHFISGCVGCEQFLFQVTLKKVTTARMCPSTNTKFKIKVNTTKNLDVSITKILCTIAILKSR